MSVQVYITVARVDNNHPQPIVQTRLALANQILSFSNKLVHRSTFESNLFIENVTT